MHAHIQVCYYNSKGETVESMVGFDPRTPEDRKLTHDMLDEYLDKFIIPRLEGEHRETSGDCGLEVYAFLDDY